MRLLSFKKGDCQQIGVLEGENVVNLSMADPSLPNELVEIISGGEIFLQQIKNCVKLAPKDSYIPLHSIDWLPPTRKAGKIICLGLNYAAHAAEGGYERPSYPSFFMRSNTSLVAHEKPIIRPQASETLDYEAELVAVVGKHARHVKRENALNYIWGYSIFNDASIREYQRKTAQWTIGKNFDSTGGFGPIVVTSDELPEGASGMQIQTRLNGNTLQNANTDMMLFNVEETVYLLTQCLTLEPGDLIVMGTPSGVGHARNPPLWMKPGDICEIEIEDIGILRNPIKEEKLSNERVR